MPIEHLEEIDNKQKREVKISTEPIPELDGATFTIHPHNTTTEKMVIAYDIAGNAIECSIDDILKNKYKPTPNWGITEAPRGKKETWWSDEEDEGMTDEEGHTRSGKCFRIKPTELTAEMMVQPPPHQRRPTLTDLSSAWYRGNDDKPNFRPNF